MDVKTGVASNVAAPVAPAHSVAAEKAAPASSGAAAPKRESAASAVAEVKNALRDALKVDPAVADRELEIDFEKDLHKIVVKVFDKESGELIRQVPLPESISISRSIRAAIRKMAGDQSGIAVDQEV
jgi:uncharacterized FlaG/YvyC family protein